ncbi:hypothetical protein GRX01_17750 [Halobaculum sp. WSA2]|uniref:Uncharacterized protein n=1 Tax=Halobaculum saliterrae TaxID=2073113 RepID=A0A6B0SWV9_9EURY|nr:hypothetical protein [Halobaculum saliterrae]MXR43175.1 hypothetical protein [Halobaculum saliterrae]
MLNHAAHDGSLVQVCIGCSSSQLLIRLRIGIEFSCRVKAGELLDPGFESFNFVTKFCGFLVLTGCQLVFEPLQACLFHVAVDLGFPNVGPLVDVVDVLFAKIGYLKRVADFVGIIDAELPYVLVGG